MAAARETLEAIVENVAKMYRLQNRAYIFKRPVEKSFARGKVIYHGTAGVDFNGFLCGSGRFIGFEAKQMKTGKNFNLKYLHRHQVEELQYIHKNGGIAFLLIHFLDGERNDFFRVPVEYLNDHIKGYDARRKKDGKRVKIVYECKGVLYYEDLIENGFLLEKNKSNVYVDILGGL